MNNATVIVALLAVGLGYSIFVVLPATLAVLWLIRLGHRPDPRPAPKSRLGRALDSRLVQLSGLVAVVIAAAVEGGIGGVIASGALIVACWWVAERFFYASPIRGGGEPTHSQP